MDIQMVVISLLEIEAVLLAICPLEMELVSLVKALGLHQGRKWATR
jgi:hypothetical protein